jgi:hypothetical protein
MPELRTEQTCRRHNHVHAAYVDAALKIEHALGNERAILFLLREGVSAAVVSRIFKFPERRRAFTPRKAPWLLSMLSMQDDINSSPP